MKKRICALLLGFLMIFSTFLTGCGDQDTQSSTPTPSNTAQGNADPSTSLPEKEKKELNLRIEYDVTALDPQNSLMPVEYSIYRNIFDNLVTFAEGDNTGPVGPELAYDWEISEDGLEYTFYLREGVKFHNGYDFSADDVVYTFDRLLQSSSAGKAAVIDHAEKVDDYTVKIILKNAYPNFLKQLASFVYGIMCKDLCEENGVTPKDTITDYSLIVGTGSYKLESVTPGVGVTLTAFEDHFFGSPYFETLNFKVIADSETAVTAFLNGEIDICTLNNSLDVDYIQGQSDYQVIQFARAAVNCIDFNCSTDVFKDNTALRKALSYGTNKEEIVELAFDGEAYADVISLLGEGEEGYSDKITDYDYNPAKAKELLSEAGYAPGELTITLTCSASGTAPDVAACWKQQMEAIGVNVELRLLEAGSAQNAQMARDYEVYFSELVSIPYNPPLTHNNYFKTGGSQFLFEHDNQEIFDLIDKANATLDDDARIALYEQVHEIMSDEAYYIPVARAKANIAAPAGLRGAVWESNIMICKYRDFYWEDYEGIYQAQTPVN